MLHAHILMLPQNKVDKKYMETNWQKFTVCYVDRYAYSQVFISVV